MFQSDASRAGKGGAVWLVTSDLAGNLAISTIDITALGWLDDRVSALEGTVGHGLRQADGGIAAAMALGGTVMPPESRIALSFKLATCHGEQGFSGAAVAKVTDHVWVSGGIAGSNVKGSTGGRLGMSFGW